MIICLMPFLKDCLTKNRLQKIKLKNGTSVCLKQNKTLGPIFFLQQNIPVIYEDNNTEISLIPIDKRNYTKYLDVIKEIKIPDEFKDGIEILGKIKRLHIAVMFNEPEFNIAGKIVPDEWLLVKIDISIVNEFYEYLKTITSPKYLAKEVELNDDELFV